MNLKNLKLFRDGFQKLMDDGIVTQETFDMEYYRSDEHGDSIVGFYSYENCGTVGCLMGWAPFIKGFEPCLYYDDPFQIMHLDFMSYVYKIFNFDLITNQEYSHVYKFLFSSEWKDFDNTPEGALARLDVFLAGDFKYLDKDFLT